MNEREENEIEVEIREHSDADFFPEKCPKCKLSKIKRLTYKFREIQDLGSPLICRRTHYERVYFQCKECEEIFCKRCLTEQGLCNECEEQRKEDNNEEQEEPKKPETNASVQSDSMGKTIVHA